MTTVIILALKYTGIRNELILDIHNLGLKIKVCFRRSEEQLIEMHEYRKIKSPVYPAKKLIRAGFTIAGLVKTKCRNIG